MLPDMESVTEGVVVEWRVAVGDVVAVDQVVVEVSTDKVNLEVPSPAAGRIASIAVPAGETFTVGEPLGQIDAGRRAPPLTRPRPRAGPPRPTPPAPGRAGRTPGRTPRPRSSGPPSRRSPAGWRSRRASTPPPSPAPGPAASSASPTCSPRPPARPRPRRPRPPRAAPAAAPSVAGEEAVPLRGPAAALAGYMDESLSIPTATSFRTLSVAALDAQRRQINGDLKAAGRSEKLSFTHLMAWAIIRAAAASVPVMGTGFAVVDGKPHKLVRGAVNLGLAVDVERKDGSRSLLVPGGARRRRGRLRRLPRRLRRPRGPHARRHR